MTFVIDAENSITALGDQETLVSSKGPVREPLGTGGSRGKVAGKWAGRNLERAGAAAGEEGHGSQAGGRADLEGNPEPERRLSRLPNARRRTKPAEKAAVRPIAKSMVLPDLSQ